MKEKSNNTLSFLLIAWEADEKYDKIKKERQVVAVKEQSISMTTDRNTDEDHVPLERKR